MDRRRFGLTVLACTIREPRRICKYDAQAACDANEQEMHLALSPIPSRVFCYCSRKDMGRKDQQGLNPNVAIRSAKHHRTRLGLSLSFLHVRAWSDEINEEVDVESLQIVCQHRGTDMHATTASPDCRQFWYYRAYPTVRYTRCGWRHCHWTSATSDA
jgi:hypothetical protein